ncbi:MAG TPA: SsgA family sporulation/cell division regulator [Pseudonocardia sp.]|nr:SsgA family sporulation/cell division regulator [Pseudonocardia sp.]
MSVRQDMFTVLHGQPAPVVTRWTYSATDPYAVGLAIRVTPDHWVEWLVARDLVAASLTGPAGEGDVRMGPRTVQGHDVVEIRLSSHDGSAVLEVDHALLRRFVTASFEVVAPGEESARMNIDEAIGRITRSCAE